MEVHKVKVADDAVIIDCTAQYDEDEFHMDPNGYLLIRPNRENNKIEVGYVKENNVIIRLYRGSNAREVCQAVVNDKILTRPEHIAYLGRETLKAEVALKANVDYVQDTDIDLSKGV